MSGPQASDSAGGFREDAGDWQGLDLLGAVFRSQSEVLSMAWTDGCRWPLKIPNVQAVGGAPLCVRFKFTGASYTCLSTSCHSGASE